MIDYFCRTGEEMLQEQRIRQTWDFLHQLKNDPKRLDAFRIDIQNLYSKIEDLIIYQLKAHKMQPACRPGCYLCCPRGGVDVELFEAIYLLTELNRKPVEAVAKNLMKTKDIVSATQSRLEVGGMFLGMAREGPANCPLLNDKGLCHVYEARPIICRLHLSTSREFCERQNQPQLTETYIAVLNKHMSGIIKDFAAAYFPLTEFGGSVCRLLSVDEKSGKIYLDVFDFPFVFE